MQNQRCSVICAGICTNQTRCFGRSRPSCSCLWTSRLHGRRGLAPDSPSSVKACRACWLSAWLHSDLWPCGSFRSVCSSRSNDASQRSCQAHQAWRGRRAFRKVVGVDSWAVHAMPWLDRLWRTPWVANKQIRGGPSDIRAKRQMVLGQFLPLAQCLASGVAMGTCGISNQMEPQLCPAIDKAKIII